MLNISGIKNKESEGIEDEQEMEQVFFKIYFTQTHDFNLLYKTTLFTPLTLQYSIYRHYLNPCNTNRLQFFIVYIARISGNKPCK